MYPDKPAAFVQIKMEFVEVLSVPFIVEGGKPENPEKNPRSKARTNSKLNPHETASTGIEPGSQRWEARAYSLRHPFSPTIVKRFRDWRFERQSESDSLWRTEGLCACNVALADLPYRPLFFIILA